MVARIADDDAMASVLADLADLRREVEELRGVRHQLTNVATTVAAVRRQLEALAADARVTPQRVVWWPDLDSEATATEWTVLTGWIDEVLLARYAEAARVLYPCWEQHTNAVDALTALHATWRAAYQDAAAPPVDAATWLDRWLPALLGQVRTALHSCERTSHTPAERR